MTYREAAATELRLSDRQIEWIEKISSVADVRAYLRGEDPGREDVADAIVYALGAATVAANVVGAWTVLANDLDVTLMSLALLASSVVLGALAVRRYVARSRQFGGRRFEIVTLTPKFDRKIVGSDPDSRTVTFLDVGAQRRVFPERLESLRVDLGQDEQLRVCIVHANERAHVEWAFPL